MFNLFILVIAFRLSLAIRQHQCQTNKYATLTQPAANMTLIIACFTRCYRFRYCEGLTP